MQYTKLNLVSEGKTKRLFATENPKQLLIEFSDSPMMYHAKKKEYFSGKGKYCNQINAIIMQVLEENNVPTHFISQVSESESICKRAEMIPVEVVVRNYSAGSMVERLGLEWHKKLKFPVLEFCYKNDDLDDPVINEYHAYAMGLCTQEEMSIMTYQAMRINKVLCDLMGELGLVVGDFKLEFGRVAGRLVVADELTPNVARFWQKDTLLKIGYGGEDKSIEYKTILEGLKRVTGK